MAGPLSLARTVDVFPCPNCRETINTSHQQCPFCSTPIDQSSAAASATEFSKLNQAYSDASFLKVMFFCQFGAWLLRNIPFASLYATLAFYFFCAAVPFMVARWWVRYSALKTHEPAFAKLRRNTVWLGVGSIVCAAALIAFNAFLVYLTAPIPRNSPR